MDSHHLILKEDEWLERLKASGEVCVTACPNLIGHTRDGWLASFQEAHRICLLANSDYEPVVFGSRAEGDSIATSRKVAVPKKGAPRDLDGSFNHVAKDEHKRAFARPLSTEIAVLIPVEQ